jgi:hypothetical protein
MKITIETSKNGVQLALIAIKKQIEIESQKSAFCEDLENLQDLTAFKNQLIEKLTSKIKTK